MVDAYQHTNQRKRNPALPFSRTGKPRCLSGSPSSVSNFGILAKGIPALLLCGNIEPIDYGILRSNIRL